MSKKGTGIPSGGKPKKQSSPDPLVQAIELGEKLIREGKLTRKQFAKMLEPLSYEGPDVGP